MDLKTFFLISPSTRMRDGLVNTAKLPHVDKALGVKKCSKIAHVTFSLCKVFGGQKHHKTSAAQSSSEPDPEPLSAPVAQSYRFEAGEQQVNNRTHCVQGTTTEKKQTDDAVTASTLELASPTTPTETEIDVEAKSETVSIETRPTTPDTVLQSAGSQLPITRQMQNDAMQRNLESAIAGYEAATKLLSQRHAALGVQPTAVSPPPTAASKIPALLKRDRAVSLPAQATPLAHQRQQPQTANDACEGYRRRQLIKDIAYRAAVENCEAAVGFIDRLNAYSTLKASYPDTPDLALYFDGIRLLVSQLGNIEWMWISRYNVTRNNAHYTERRLMGPEDCEIIFTQLFPAEYARLYEPEHFDVFVTGLGEEGILTKQEAKKVAALGVTTEELDGGAHFTGPSRPRYAYRNDPSAIRLFNIPKQPCHTIETYSNGAMKYPEQDLFFHLRILAEAAVYNQNFWKGYFFTNARSIINDFHAAYVVTQDGWSLPPNLTDFKRPWTYRQVRLLQRAYIIGRMLDMWDAGQLKDYGLVRAVSGTYVHIPMQAFWSAEELESFLYSRVTDSGLPIDKIPEILALHPENDGAFADRSTRITTIKGLVYRAQLFEEEEEHRLSQIEKSLTSFETILKAQMTPWQRVKAKLRRTLGKEEKLVPFDPFAPEHEREQCK